VATLGLEGSARQSIQPDGGSNRSISNSPKSTRLISLDLVRGVMLIASVGVDAWVTDPAWFDHANWIGIHPVDWIFPIFVTLSGCGLAYANARRINVRSAVRRVVILFAFGLLYNYINFSGTPFHWDTLRLTGVLQLYAVVVVAMVFLHTFVKGWRQWALMTAILSLLDTAAQWGWSLRCSSGQLTPSCNISRSLDPLIYGSSHLLSGGTMGYDPEGVISIVGALVTACLGATVGHALLASRKSGGKPAAIRSVGSTIVGALLLAGVLDLFVPAFKKQWTPPFALLLGAAAATALLIAHLIVDPTVNGGGLHTKRQQAIVWPFLALGRNSLFVYFGSHALVLVLLVHNYGGAYWVTHFSKTIAIFGNPTVTFIVVAEAFWISMACLLHWKRIYLRP
jgi:heparan-alpha-glucosaminide N-acetyltransferase